MIKTKYNKNPDLKGKEYIDDKFFYQLNGLLLRALYIKYYRANRKLFTVNKEYINELVDDISSILIYKNIGFKKCKDCKKDYTKCTCDYLETENFKNIDDIIKKIENIILQYGSEGDKNNTVQFLKDDIHSDTDQQLIKFINESIKRLTK